MKYRNFKQPNAYQYELKNQTNFPALWLQTIHLPLSVSLVLHKICIYLCETICEIESRCLKANKPAKTEATPAATTENAIPKKRIGVGVTKIDSEVQVPRGLHSRYLNFWPKPLNNICILRTKIDQSWLCKRYHLFMQVLMGNFRCML